MRKMPLSASKSSSDVLKQSHDWIFRPRKPQDQSYGAPTAATSATNAPERIAPASNSDEATPTTDMDTSMVPGEDIDPSEVTGERGWMVCYRNRMVHRADVCPNPTPFHCQGCGQHASEDIRARLNARSAKETTHLETKAARDASSHRLFKASHPTSRYQGKTLPSTHQDPVGRQRRQASTSRGPLLTYLLARMSNLALPVHRLLRTDLSIPPRRTTIQHPQSPPKEESDCSSIYVKELEFMAGIEKISEKVKEAMSPSIASKGGDGPSNKPFQAQADLIRSART
ncbi:hypothetical protein HPB48_019297 [Haemaphysalis longicornis]|uniref:Uncharacterized protein n=1 Tax=Haemaphysalis longicornis TaxID=44386 RepID=A0A9J6GUI0_HAELO|nr:hypothetical protein HPB48_019297 [Haemaphysalis longicornis]